MDTIFKIIFSLCTKFLLPLPMTASKLSITVYTEERIKMNLYRGSRASEKGKYHSVRDNNESIIHAIKPLKYITLNLLGAQSGLNKHIYSCMCSQLA